MKELSEFVFGSIEPLLITDEFLSRLQKLEKICHHFHLSLQSGCDETLLRMNRRYTTKQFAEIVQKLRNTYEDVILTTDIIVGFPGETEEEFEKTKDFLEKIKFYKMHIFKYSVRSGTKAEKMEHQIINRVKEERSQRLMEMSEKNQEFYHRQWIGKKVDILVEEKDGEFYQGHTANYLLVKMKSNTDLINQIEIVTIQKFSNAELIAENVTKM